MRVYLMFLAYCCLSVAHAAPVNIAHQGLTLRGELRMPSPGAPTVLLVHGTLAHHEMELINTLQDLLEERAANSLAITLSLGVDSRTGMFDCATPHTHTHDDALEEIDSWLAWLQNRGVKDTALLGHSRGGNRVARYVTSRQPGLVNKLILLAPASADDETVSSRYTARHGKQLAPLLQQARSAEKTAWLSSVGFMYCEDTKVRADTFLSYYDKGEGHDTIRLLANTDTATLVITGTSDTITEGMAKRLENLSLNHVTAVAIDGAGHFFRDLFADEAVDHIEAFLE
ncbi:MAG: alpha/beta fold hydrolase [Gammaproteobacteria bacterium]|nr:alpha/beta fold hydrolase [Gammaproteobacteria bacterium]